MHPDKYERAGCRLRWKCLTPIPSRYTRCRDQSPQWHACCRRQCFLMLCMLDSIYYIHCLTLHNIALHWIFSLVLFCCVIFAIFLCCLFLAVWLQCSIKSESEFGEQLGTSLVIEIFVSVLPVKIVLPQD